VTLVASLPGKQEAEGNSVATGPIVPLWAGEDLTLHTSLLEELGAVGIRYFSKPMGAFPGSRQGNPFPIDPVARFGYQVAVLSSSLPEARAILEKLLDEEPQDMELPERTDSAEVASRPPASAEEKPTCEIWAGVNDGIAQFLTAALQENEISIHLDTAGDLTKVLVSIANEARAREIVREIVNAAPPE